jgi:dTDP-4-amino-4,6-dideoxygalactose transaminase
MIAPIRCEVRLADVLSSLFRNRGYRNKLEVELINYFGAGRVQLTHSGRSALYYLLKALPQRKVYVPAYNCWAVAEAVLYAKKEIEYVDITLDDFNMDVARLREVLEPDSIVIATHQFGIPCDIDAIQELATERRCVVLEDNAGAFGSEIRGRRTGTFARAAILSFDYSKTVVSGKGGAILFNDEELYQKVRGVYQNEVMPCRAWNSLKYLLMALGYAYLTHKRIYPLTYAIFRQIRGSSRAEKKLILDNNESYLLDYDDMRAKLAYLNVRRVDTIIRKKLAICSLYLDDMDLPDKIKLPVVPDFVKAVMIKLPFISEKTDRDSVYQQCLDNGVDIEYTFPYWYSNEQNQCPNSEVAARQAMSLPVYSALIVDDCTMIKKVVEAA